MKKIHFNKKVTVAILALFLLMIGCQTYSLRPAQMQGDTRGYPFIFVKPYKAIVTYEGGAQSVHVANIPTLWGVDVERSALGLTKVKFENNSEGLPLKTDVNLDQKTAEHIEALSKLLSDLGMTFKEGPPKAPVKAPATVFYPKINEKKTIKDIELFPIQD